MNKNKVKENAAGIVSYGTKYKLNIFKTVIKPITEQRKKTPFNKIANYDRFKNSLEQQLPVRKAIVFLLCRSSYGYEIMVQQLSCY